MGSVKILYHPKFEPKESWLRAMLLFYDTVYSIVPKKAGYTPSPGIAALCEQVPDAFVPLAPNEQDLQYEWVQFNALTSVLRELATEGEGKERARARFDWRDGVPSLAIGTAVEVHSDKMAEELTNQLIALGLAKRTDDQQWLNVDQRVADLILSMLADRMARNRPEVIYTSSDQETSFAVATKSELNRGRDRFDSWKPEATLASAILTLEIPANIADLPLARYLDIRRRYQENREVFRLAMQELQTLYLQGGFQQPDAFHEELEGVVTKFSQQMQALRERQFKRKIIRWAPVVLGGIVSISASAISSPIVAIPAACIGVSLQVLQTTQGERLQGTYVAKAQSLLIELNRELQWNRSWLSRVFFT